MKKVLPKLLVLTFILLTITACGTKEQKQAYTLKEILSKVYAPVGEDCPKMTQTKLTKENLSYINKSR